LFKVGDVAALAVGIGGRATQAATILLIIAALLAGATAAASILAA
jgi:hypothetical protein